MIVNEISPKKTQKFYCENCNFNTSNKKDYSRHLNTKKHNSNIFQGFSIDFTPKNPTTVYTCNCGKNYKDSSGLWRHKKKCNTITNNIVEDTNTIVKPSNEVFMTLLNQNMELIKQNQEFKNLITEQNKNILEITGKIGNTNCNNNNTTNNHFNLQFFLNETCKDALNIDDFVKQIKLQLSDLDMIGRVGYVNGMSKIIIRNLNELDVCKRPIHCTDLKREILYVKDNNAWEKEKGENVKLKKAIKGIECKNIKQIPQWVEENPTSEDTDTKKHLEYKNIVLEAMGGSISEDDNKNHEKIIRNVAKEVTIDKTIK